MNETLTIEFSELGLLTVEGVSVSVAFLKKVLNDPPTDRLISVKRVGNNLVFESFTNAQACENFFKELKQN